MTRRLLALSLLVAFLLACGGTAPVPPVSPIRLPAPVYAVRFEPPGDNMEIHVITRMYRTPQPTDRAGLWLLEP